MKLRFKVVIMLVVVLLLLTGTAATFITQVNGDENTAIDDEIKTVPTKSVLVYDDIKFSTYETTASAITQLFNEQDINIITGDSITVFANADKTQELKYDDDLQLVNGMLINIHRAMSVKLVLNNDPKTFRTQKETVQDILDILPADDNVLYVLQDYKATDKLFDTMTLVVNSQTKKIVKTTEVVPYKSKNVDNDDLDKGVTKVKQKGINGETITTIEETYLAGFKSSTKNLGTIVSAVVVDEVIEVGTKEPRPTVAGNIYSETFTVVATAYTAGSKARTFTGIKPYEGVIAVDPKVIPLGTKVYVEGYGVAVAADTGGSIKGKKIDLFYDTYSECINFGRKSVKIYILD